MFRKLLIPVDFSEKTESSTRLHQLLAPDVPRELLHVVANQDYAQPSFTSAQFAFGQAFHGRVLDAAKSEMEKLVEERIQLGETRCSGLVITGSAPEEIAEHARDTDTDLIVMSTHGRTGVSRWLLGSVTERVLRLAPCPVLVERNVLPGASPTVKKILVGVDFSEHSRRALDLAVKIAGRLDSQLECFHVWSSPYAGYSHSILADGFNYWAETAASQMKEFLETANLPSSLDWKSSVVPGAPASKLMEKMEAEHPDLLVLGTHGYRGIKRLALGSVAEVTVRYASCTTLVVPSS